jgi:hypothetical protein
MTKATIVPMQSSRLAQYVVPIPCYVCAAENTYDAEHCTHCGAPMALAHQANSQGIRPQMMACIGASGVGKTVYLGMLLDMLSRQPEVVQLLARGAFSINLQQTTISALSRCEFPPKTPNEPDRWNWVHAQLRRPSAERVVELIMPDMAGEALLEEVDHAHTYRGIRAFLNKCAGALLLVDATQFRDAGGPHQFSATKLLSYLNELNDGLSPGWNKRPLAIVFTKADQVEECFDDAEGYAKAHAAGMWQQCCEQFQTRRFFAASVAGACAWRESIVDGRVQVPLRVEPRGIVEPFLWLFEQLTGRKR